MIAFRYEPPKVNGGIIIVVMTILCFVSPPTYSTVILANGEKHQFDDSYKAYLVDQKYGELSIKYEIGIEACIIWIKRNYSATVQATKA